MMDSGQYQCQINTDSTSSVTMVLNIIGEMIRKIFETLHKIFQLERQARSEQQQDSIEDKKDVEDIANNAPEEESGVLVSDNDNNEEESEDSEEAERNSQNILSTLLTSPSTPLDTNQYQVNLSLMLDNPCLLQRSDSSGQVLMISMSVFSVAVLIMIVTGCSIGNNNIVIVLIIMILSGIYNKIRYPEPERPVSRTGTIDSRRSGGSRRSDGSTGSRRSRRRSRRHDEDVDTLERKNKRRSRRLDHDDEEELYAEISKDTVSETYVRDESLKRKKKNLIHSSKVPDVSYNVAGDNYFLRDSVDVSSLPLYLNKSELCKHYVDLTPTQRRQQVDMNSFRSLPRYYDHDPALMKKNGVVFASAESLNSEQSKQNGRKIRFNDEKR